MKEFGGARTYEQFWGFKASDRANLKSVIGNSTVSEKPLSTFLDSYVKPSVGLASIHASLGIIFMDVLFNKSKIGLFLTDLMNSTVLNGHNTMQGLTYTSASLVLSQLAFSKLDQVISSNRTKSKHQASVDRFIEVEYPKL